MLFRSSVPVHQCCLVAMGVHLLDNLDLSRLAATCAERERWEFLFAVAPLCVRSSGMLPGVADRMATG